MRRWILLIATVTALIFLSGLTASAFIAWKMWRLSKPTTTVVRMRDLMDVLKADQPQSLDAKAIKLLLAQNGREECLLDGWGRPFVIEQISPGPPSVYRVTSVGKDGQRGSCCKGIARSFEEDAVLEGDRWLQRWSFDLDEVARSGG